MRNFKITSEHSIYTNSFKTGEQSFERVFHLGNTLQADTPEEAIAKYFKNYLFYDFDMSNAVTDIDDNYTLYYSVLADENGTKATENQLNLWKMGKRKLYTDNIRILMQELINISF
jgi:hypothetical protein